MTTTALERPITALTSPVLTLVPLQHPLIARAVRRLADGQQMHRAVMSLFPDGLAAGGDPARAAGGVLYRVDSTTSRPARLLVQHRCPLRSGLEGPALQQADLGPLLTALKPGTRVHFRIVLNAVLSQTATRKRLAVTGDDDLAGWGLQRLTGAGLSRVQLSDRPVTALSHAQGPLWTARYDGLANVTDPVLLGEAVQQGIGRAKAYGCGLLSLAIGR